MSRSGRFWLTHLASFCTVLLANLLVSELFSVNEAAAIAEVSPETIRTALEKKSVKLSHKRKTGKAVRH
jgi:hypothetical protein